MPKIKVKDFLTEENWVKGAAAVDNFGTKVSPRSNLAVKWCFLGAVEKCYMFTGLFGSIMGKIEEKFKDNGLWPNPIRFNDNPKTTFSDVKKLIEELDI